MILTYHNMTYLRRYTSYYIGHIVVNQIELIIITFELSRVELNSIDQPRV